MGTRCPKKLLLRGLCFRGCDVYSIVMRKDSGVAGWIRSKDRACDAMSIAAASNKRLKPWSHVSPAVSQTCQWKDHVEKGSADVYKLSHSSHSSIPIKLHLFFYQNLSSTSS
jgi:hypothetical protein